MMPHPMPTVALFASSFLAPTQTFIHDELRHHRRYDIEVFTRRRLHAERFPYTPVHVAEPWFGVLPWSPRFDRRFRARRFDLIHAHFGWSGVLAMGYARRFRLPLVVTFHGHDVPLLTSRERFKLEFLGYGLRGRRLLREMSLGLCVTRDLRDRLLALDVPEKRLAVHALGIDLARFVPTPRTDGAIEVLMVGRLVEKKGFGHGLEACARAAARCAAPLRLSVIGDGPLRGFLVERARSLDLAVEFTGLLAPDEVARRLATADVLLAPSIVAASGDREGLPMVVKEAAASECVVIASRHGGMAEAIDDGVTGFLVAEHDVAALADRLALVAADAELRHRMGGAARAKMAREFDLGVRVDALENTYDAVIAAHSGRAGS